MIDAFTDGDDVCWFGTDDAVYRFDQHIAPNLPRELQTLYRSFEIDGTVVHRGGGTAVPDTTLIVPDGARRIRIRFASGQVTLEESMLYTWWLEGYEDDWNAPEQRHIAEYVDLPPGDYVFHVKTMLPGNGHGVESHIAFTVTAPWYRECWLLVLLAALVLLAVIVLLLRRRRSSR